MKKWDYTLLILGASLLLLSGCDSDEVFNQEDFIWKPKLTVTTDSEELTLSLSTSYTGWCGTGITDPEKMVLYYSENRNKGYQKVSDIEPNTGVYQKTLQELENNKAYYFYVMSTKKHYPVIYSDTLQVIPIR